MVTSRRHFLRAAGGFGLAAPAASLQAAVPDHLVFGSAVRSGRHTVIGFDETGRNRFAVSLPGRGHGFAVSAEVAVVFGRRPGRWAVAFERRTGRAIATLCSARHRHFQGHGVFARNARLLFATENDYERHRGVIGIYDAANGFRRIGECETGGIGPHEIIRRPDNGRLIVANGGRATHPDMPRVVLNPGGVHASIVEIDPMTTKWSGRWILPAAFQGVSLRHLAAAADGTIVFGCQAGGAMHPNRPMAGMIHVPKNGKTQRGLEFLQQDRTVAAALRGYVGSVAVDTANTVAAASSPRGNAAVFWYLETGKRFFVVRVPDVCGLAPARAPGCFIASTGMGYLVAINTASGKVQHIHHTNSVRWDNHLGG